MWGISSLLVDHESIGSLQSRHEQIKFALNLANNKPLAFFIGNGPAKEILQYPENNILYYFFRYGVLGVVLYFYYPICLLVFLSFRKNGLFRNIMIIFKYE